MATIKEAIEYSKVNPDSAFANELRRRIESGEMDKELQSEGLVQYMSKPPEQSFGSKMMDTGKKLVEEVKDTTGRVMEGETSLESGLLQTGGAVAEAGLGTVGNVLTSTPVVKDVVKTVAGPISEGIKAFQGWLSNNPQFQSAVSNETSNAIADFLDKNPDIARNAEAVNNIANAVLTVKGGVQTAGTAKNVAEAGIDLTKQGVAKTKAGVQAVGEAPVIQGVGTALSGIKESVKRIPSRMATNAAEKQAIEAEIASLPSKTAQTAVRDGIDIADVKELSSLPKTPQVNKLIQTVKNYANGDKTVDPIEVVGEPMIKRVKSLDADRKIVGKQLGEASKEIGILTKPELENGVLTRLREVPGLENVQVKNGTLDFKGTTLDNALSDADRTALQEAFTEATRWGDGEKAHMFRQTLFETLGGKKKSLTNITDTQERGYEAIRSGLSDVIETKSTKYKSLSNEYRKIVQPLSDLRKLMKNIDPNSTDDILNMSAGLLARRITSASASNPQIKQLLQALDNAGLKKGLTKESVTQLQDMYNILNKYYDIAPKTGFQNLVKEGVGVSDTITGTVKEFAKDIAGKSNAVRQKALEDLLNSIK